LGNQNNEDAVTILKELERLILLSLDEHGQEMHDQSVKLLRHIDRTLKEIRVQHITKRIKALDHGDD
jgi:hypothetical protein